MTLHFINGDKIAFKREGFHFELARLLQLNSARIPFYTIKDALSGCSHPTWLHDHLPKSALAVLSHEGECHFCYGEETSAYTFYYRSLKGVEYERNKNITHQMEQEDCSWY